MSRSCKRDRRFEVAGVGRRSASKARERWRLAAASLASLVAVTLSPDAAPCNRLGSDWPQNVTYYVVNVNDFAAGLLPALSLTTTQARFWVEWASSQWHERTDASFYPLYVGDTTAHAVNCGGASDNINQIDVTSSCFEPGCTTWARTQFYSGS